MWIEIGKIGGVIIGGAVGALIGAVIVRLATNLTAKFIPPFGMAYKASFTGIFAITLLGMLVGYIEGATGTQLGIYGLISVLGCFSLVYAGILSILIKDEEGRSIGFGKAYLISLIQWVSEILFLVLIWLLVAKLEFTSSSVFWFTVFGAGLLLLLAAMKRFRESKQ